MFKLSTQLRIIVLVILSIIAVGSVQAQDGPNLIGAFFVKGKIGLKWNATDGAEQYAIYRQSNGGEFVKIGTSDNTNYFDTKIDGGVNYTYKIAAVVGGNEVFGNTKSVSTPASIDAFSAPKSLESRYDQRGSNIFLQWSKVKGAIAYNILRSTTPGTGYEIVGNASTDKYVDKEGLVAGTTYYYVITAMNDEFEESEPSEETVIKFGLSEEEQKALEEEESNIKLDSINITLVYEVSEADGIAFSNPTNLAFNSAGDIYMTDINNHRIVVMDGNGKFKFSFGKTMYKDQLDNPPDGAFLSPFTIAIGKDDRVYVSDVQRNDIQVFSPKGEFQKALKVDVGDEKPFRANGLQIFDDNRILCTDVGNHRILVLDQDGKILIENKASSTFLAHYPNGLQLLDQEHFVFTNPVMGNVVVSNLKGEVSKAFGGQGMTVGVFGRAVAVTTSEDGYFWVTDAMGGTIQAFNPDGEVKLAISNDKIPQEEFKLVKPRGIVVKDSTIYVVNGGAGRLMAFKYAVTKVEE